MRVLSLDLSTTGTGWAIFEGERLVDYGVIKPKVTKEYKHLQYPFFQLMKMHNICRQIVSVVATGPWDHIVIEEINRGKNRLGQKTLDGLHWILMEYLWQEGQDGVVKFFDSDGRDGWRSARGLGLQLSPTDKLQNKEISKFNKKVAKKSQKTKITQKTLCCRYVNKKYGLKLTEKENDIADAIGLGDFFITKIGG